MADSRKAELERKKAKLQAIREEKERRRREKEAKVAEDAAPARVKSEKDLRAETDEMLADLGILPPGELLSSLPSSTTSASELSITMTPDTSFQSSSVSLMKLPARVKKSALSVVTVHQTNIPPKEQVTYNKQTQTATTATEREGSLATTPSCKDFEWWRTKKAQPLDYYDGHFVYPAFEWDDEFPVLVYDDITGDEDESSSLPTMEASPPVFGTHHKMTGMPHVEMVKPAQTIEEVAAVKVEESKHPEPVELTEEERHKIMISAQFQRFFDHSSRIIERALYEYGNIFIDYAGGDSEEKDGEDKSGNKLSMNRFFMDERWSKNRIVTCLDWSTQYPELMVASYDHNGESPHDPDGVTLVWNTKFKKTTPEYIFHCQSAVMSATFAKFHPSLIIGGTYSGQIVLWDNRSSKRTPIQRSPLSSTAHTHPIYCVKVVGTQNAHNIVSISTDGKLCTWSLDMLSQPQDTMELQHKQSKAVAVTSLTFPSGDVNNFVVGSEEGTVYAACRHGSKAGVMDFFEGHQGPVTGIDTHSAHGQIDFSHLFLTSSFDWTVKLWSLKENKPLYSFEDYGDYVYDVRWSPTHPALFASVDGTGRIDVWNLNNDTEAPTASVVVEGNAALNRVSWSQSGHQVVAGDDMGKVWVYDVGEQLANPRNDEWSKLVHTLQELKNNQADEEDHFNKSLGMPIR